MVDPASSPDVDEIRNQENQEVSERFQSTLNGRGQRSPFSPSFLATQPKSMVEKLHVTPEQEEQIRYLYAATYSIHQTASSCGVSLDKVRAVVYSPESTELIAQYRESLKVSVLQKIEEAQVVLLDAVQDPDKLKNSSITQISEVFTEISEVQGNLISSLQANRNPIDAMDAGQVFSGEELEYMMLLRRRLSMGGSPDPEENPNYDAPLDVIDTDLSPSEDSVDPRPPDSWTMEDKTPILEVIPPTPFDASFTIDWEDEDPEGDA